MQKILPLIEEWEVEEMWVGMFIFDSGQNNRPTILKEFGEVGFPKLRFLAIWKNGIESLEGLQRFKFPSMNWINFGAYKLI